MSENALYPPQRADVDGGATVPAFIDLREDPEEMRGDTM